MESLIKMPATVGQRVLLPELMDDPELDAGRHRAALRGLARINAVSGSVKMLWPAIQEAAELRLGGGLDGPLRVMDVASGAGDVAVGLLQLARKSGLAVHVEAVDISKVAMEFTQERALAAGFTVRWSDDPSDVESDMTLRVHDVMADELPSADVVISSLFLHHLSAKQAVEVLRSMSLSGWMVLVNDLRRCRPGFVTAAIGTRLLSRSHVVHVDGPQSVRAAWTPDEMKALADAAGLGSARVDKRFPWRMLLEWRRA